MTNVTIASPITGWLTNVSSVPDPVFADRMLGDGVAIDPVDGVVYAPAAGRIVSVHPARHAVTLESDSGVTLLVHIGLETVALAGDGFTAEVREGDRVTLGARLISFDLDFVGRQAKSLITPVVVTDGGEVDVLPTLDRMIQAGEPLFEVRLRSLALEASDPTKPDHAQDVELPLRHGLHARPAARIAERARDFEARVIILAADGRSASARSPVAILALALAHGAKLTVQGWGGDAEQAVCAIASLIEGGMGESAPIPTTALSRPAELIVAQGPVPDRLRGVMAAPGIAMGAAWSLIRTEIEVPEQGEGPDQERAALSSALEKLQAEIFGGEGALASIAAAHQAFLGDPELLAAAESAIAAGQSAGGAWREAIQGFATLLGKAGDARFSERVDDLRDLESRVLMELYGAPENALPPVGAILVSKDLLPSQLMALADTGIAGLATGGGGPTSHVAIIAAGLGLPMLAALGDDVARIADGTPLLLDGASATLSINPSQELLAQSREDTARVVRFRDEASARSHEAAITRDGTRIEIFANLGSIDEAWAAARAGAEGCGLLRTEFLFLDRPSPPDEDEQVSTYQAIADALAGKPLIVRTLDIGADKPALYLPLPSEENPALGLRGLRLSLARPDMLRTQLRALSRIKGDVRVMLPMVVEAAEIRSVREILSETGDRALPLGIMVETPAAAMLADALALEADFLSIGSNDLSQYALAMDRGNPAVAAGLDGLHPAVLRLIASTVEGGKLAAKWTGICGGLAADPLAVPILVGLGINELSVPPGAVSETKERVRRIDRMAAHVCARAALDADSAQAVRSLARDFIEGMDG